MKENPLNLELLQIESEAALKVFSEEGIDLTTQNLTHEVRALAGAVNESWGQLSSLTNQTTDIRAFLTEKLSLVPISDIEKGEWHLLAWRGGSGLDPHWNIDLARKQTEAYGGGMVTVSHVPLVRILRSGEIEAPAERFRLWIQVQKDALVARRIGNLSDPEGASG